MKLFPNLIVTLLVISVSAASCSGKYSKSDMAMYKYASDVNKMLPKQLNDWLWMDSVVYNHKSKTYTQFLHIIVEDSQREMYKELFKNQDVMKSCVGKIDNSFFIENNVSYGETILFADGELCGSYVFTVKELKDMANHVNTDEETTFQIYRNMAISINAEAPTKLDEHTTLTGADFNEQKMEFTMYWYVEREILDLMEEAGVDIHDVLRDALVEQINYSYSNQVKGERFQDKTTYRRSHFPIRMTLVCKSDNGYSVSESVLSSDVINQ